MNTVPKPLVERVQFFETHLAAFAANATRIGTTLEEVALLRDRTVAARAAYVAQQRGRLAARSATLAFNLAVAAMSDAGAMVIAQVHAKGRTDAHAYNLAALPAPAARSRMGRPGTPTRFTVALDARGAVTLAWACENPRGSKGTQYYVRRRLTAGGGFDDLGVTGKKRFVDATVPAGATSITYQVRAARSTAVGDWAAFDVRFGTDARRAAA